MLVILLIRFIISDSNSSDNTVKIIKENFPNVEIIKGEK